MNLKNRFAGEFVLRTLPCSSSRQMFSKVDPLHLIILTVTDPHTFLPPPPPPPPFSLLGYKIELVVKHDSTQTIMDLVREKLPGT